MATRRRIRGFWLRTQETPVELSISLLACAVAVLTLGTHAQHLSWIGITVYAVLGLGGALSAFGRVVDDLAVEAAGLAAMIAALWFVTAVSLNHAQGFAEAVHVVLNSGAIVVGFGIRLYVVRRATKARERAAEIIADREAVHDG